MARVFYMKNVVQKPFCYIIFKMEVEDKTHGITFELSI
jgi:hypothetical protein